MNVTETESGLPYVSSHALKLCGLAEPPPKRAAHVWAPPSAPCADCAGPFWQVIGSCSRESEMHITEAVSGQPVNRRIEPPSPALRAHRTTGQALHVRTITTSDRTRRLRSTPQHVLAGRQKTSRLSTRKVTELS